MLQLVHLGFLHQISGNTNHVGIVGIEGKVAKILLESPLHNIQNILRVLVNGSVNGEKVSCSGGEVMVEMRQNFHLVCQILRFLSDGDSGSRADFHICGDPYLGMEEEMSVADLTIRILVGFVKGRNAVHNLYP